MLISVITIVSVSSYNITETSFIPVSNDSSTKTNNFQSQSELDIEKENSEQKKMVAFSTIGFLIVLLAILSLLSYGLYRKRNQTDDRILILDDADYLVPNDEQEIL